MVLRDVIDVDALPEPVHERLVLQRLARMHRGELVRLESSCHLHPLWRRHYELDPASHSWVYELAGPNPWRACLTRHSDDD